MDFIEQFDPENGNEESRQAVENATITYLDKKQPCDMVVRVDKAFIKESEKDEGVEKFIAVLTVLQKEVGQNDAGNDGTGDLLVGDQCSYYVSMSTKLSKSRQKYNFLDIVDFLAAASGRRDKDIIAAPKTVYDIVEDDGAEIQDAVLHLTTKPPKDGWYNFRWELIPDYEEAAAE